MNRFVFAFLGLLMLPRAAELAAPFLLGFLLYLLCRNPVRRMTVHGLRRGTAAFFSLAFLCAVALGVASVLLIMAVDGGLRLPELYAHLSADGGGSLPLRFLETFRDQLAEALRSLAVKLLSGLGNLTGFLMTLLFAVLAAYFFLRDEEKLVDITRQIGGGAFFGKLLNLREALSTALSGYLRAQGLLMGLIFVILSVFFLLFGVSHALPAALGVAFVDAVPVFGSGFVLLPWALYEFLSGDAALGFGLLALYGVCSLTRQILEPRLIGAGLGLHPLLSLAGVFVGFRLFGFWGLLLGPMLMLVFVSYIQKSS